MAARARDGKTHAPIVHFAVYEICYAQMKMIVFLVRHGKTEANRMVVYAGRLNDSLLPESRKGVLQLTDYLALQRVRYILSSPQRRAQESALPLAKKLSIPIESNDALAEMNMGPWTGLTDKDISSRFPTVWREWRSTPNTVKFEDFEGLESVQKRVSRWLRRLGDEYPEGGNIVAFTHETVVKVAVDWVVGANLASYRKLIVPNLSVSSIELIDSSWRLRSVNEFIPALPYC